MKLLEGKVAVVTGAARGIGKAIALEFAKQGADVAFTDLTIDENGKATEAEIAALGVKAKGYASNAANFEETHKVIEQIVADFGRIDVLVNNAGVVFNKKIGMIVREETELMFRINVIAVIELTQLVSRIMARTGGGSIVNIASVTAVLGSAGQSAYSATKGAIISFTKSAAKELAPQGVRVNAVAPGIVKTERFEELYEASGDKIDARIGRIALGRLGLPEDIARACSFLASDNASYISGQILGVDGCASI